MFGKSYKLSVGFVVVLAIFGIELLYIANTKTATIEDNKMKNQFVQLIGLPDLAISTEANYIRHRSLVDIFSIYRDDGNLREYSPSSYTYSIQKGLFEN